MQSQFPNHAPLLGIVTVLYNSDDVLLGFFESLAAQEQPHSFRLYVIDNSAQDSGSRLSETLARQYNIDARVHFNNANVGVAKGNNQGIELALADGCKQVLLANNDTEFGSDTLKLLQAALADGNELAATPKIMYHEEPTRIWYSGGHISPWTMRTPHHGMGQIDRGQFDSHTYVDYAPTCFLLLDASVFHSVGRMDEQFFVYYDDTDFVWRMAKWGIRIRFVPQAVVMHKVSSSTGGDRSPFSVFYTNRNRIYFIRKNLRGLKKVVALNYFFLTRLPRFGGMPRQLAVRGWRGVLEGFKMNLPVLPP